MFKKFEGGARNVMTGLVRTLGDDYREWYENYAHGVQDEKLSSRHVNALLSGCFWELENGVLVPRPVHVSKPNEAIEQLQDHFYVAPKFTEDGKAQPEYFVVTLKEEDRYKLFLTDRENMHRVKESLKPNLWNRLCDNVKKIFGSRDKVCQRWDEYYKDMKLPLENMPQGPENEAQALASEQPKPQATERPKLTASQLAQLVEGADLPITDMGMREASFLEQDRHARSELVNGREQISSQADFLPKMFMAVVSETVKVPADSGAQGDYVEPFLEGTLKLLAMPVDTNLRGYAAGKRMEDIELFAERPGHGVSDTAQCMASAQNELMCETDLLSPATRMKFGIYEATDRMHREGRGPAGMSEALDDEKGALMNLDRDELRAFQGLCRCYRELNNASQVKAGLLRGEIGEEELPRAAIALQKGKQAEALLESLDGVCFYRMKPEQLEKLRAFPVTCDELKNNPRVLEAAQSCMKPGDYLGSLRAISNLVQRNGLFRALGVPKLEPLKQEELKTRPRSKTIAASPDRKGPVL